MTATAKTPRHPIVQRWLNNDIDDGGCIAALERELAEALEAFTEQSTGHGKALHRIEELEKSFSDETGDAKRYRKLRAATLKSFEQAGLTPEIETEDWELALAVAEDSAEFDSIVDALPEAPSK